jgi:hypothetical protein
MVTTVSYFQFPLISADDKPIHIMIFKQGNPLTFYDKAYKINNHSGIAWCKTKFTGTYAIEYFDYSAIYLLDYHLSMLIYTIMICLLF